MKRTIVTLCSLPLFLLSSCATNTTPVTNPYGLWQPSDSPAPGPTPIGPPLHAPDPVVVDAEKTLLIARDTFNLYVHLEKEHNATLASASPKFHDFADKLRRDSIGWLRTANRMKNAYKHSRTLEAKANLLTALATVSQALVETKTMIAQSGLTGP